MRRSESTKSAITDRIYNIVFQQLQSKVGKVRLIEILLGGIPRLLQRQVSRSCRGNENRGNVMSRLMIVVEFEVSPSTTAPSSN